MAVNPGQFEEKKWRKPLRHLKEDCLVFAGRLMRALGLLNDLPGNPVFIIGSPRSGTSIFNKMISECDDVADLSEAIFIWSPGDKDLDCDHVKDDKDVTKEDVSRIRGAFGFYQFMLGKSIFVNKCPRSSVRIQFIRSIFPDAKFIHVYRDGRAVVSSIIDIVSREKFRTQLPLGGFCKPENWRELMYFGEVERHAYQWSEIMKVVNTESKKVSSDQWLDVKYEDFCSDPSGVMNTVFDFIGSKPSRELLSSIAEMPLKMDDKWRVKLTPSDISKMTSIMKQQLWEYGYEQ